MKIDSGCVLSVVYACRYVRYPERAKKKAAKNTNRNLPCDLAELPGPGNCTTVCYKELQERHIPCCPPSPPVEDRLAGSGYPNFTQDYCTAPRETSDSRVSVDARHAFLHVSANLKSCDAVGNGPDTRPLMAVLVCVDAVRRACLTFDIRGRWSRVCSKDGG